MGPENELRVIAITAPTAVGKTELILRLSDFVRIEVVSCDSRKVFKLLDVGTAKPTPEERRKTPFHLIDILEPAESFSVEEFTSLANRTVCQIFERKALPVLEGGTGLFIASLAYRYEFGDAPPIEELRRAMNDKFEEMGYLSVLPNLLKVFPDAEKTTDVYNPARMIRLVENRLIAMTQSELKKALAKLECPEILKAVQRAKDIANREKSTRVIPPSYSVEGYILDMDRNTLWQRIRERTRKMFAEGLVEEVKGLMDAGVPEDSQAMTGIGYAQAIRFLKGEISAQEAEEQVVIATRQLAKRQATWNKHQFPDFQKLPYSTLAEQERAFKILLASSKTAHERNLTILESRRKS